MKSLKIQENNAKARNVDAYGTVAFILKYICSYPKYETI